jgi:PAS domain S-box-containing protein
LATLLPVALFAAIVGYFLVDEERETFRRGAEERTLAMVTAVDAELRGSLDTIQALSLVASLTDDNLSYFRGAAKQVLAGQPNWTTIDLTLPDGRRVLDLIAADDAPLPPTQRFEPSFERALQTFKPAIGDLAMGPVSKRWNYTVRAPVVRDGAVKYVLSAVVAPESIGQLVSAQNVPPGWVAVVLDSSNRIVARTVAPEESRGQLASQSLRDALARAPSGWFRGSTIEGTEVYTPYRRSAISGWAFAMGIPASAVDAAAWRAAGLLAAGLLGALALAFAVAHLVGRRISAPIAALAAATDALGRGERVPVPQSAAITEVSGLARTLQASIDAMREREERFRLMADAAPVLIWLAGTDQRCTWFNKPWLDFVGRTMEQELGDGWTENVHPEDSDRCLTTYTTAFDARQPFSVEYRLRRRDGEYRWVLDNGAPRFAAAGEFSGYIGSCVDITDLKQAGETLRASAERLQLALDAGRMGSWQWDIQSNKVTWSADLEAIHGLAPGTFPGTFEAYQKDIHPDDRANVQQAIARSLEQGEHHIEYRIVLPDGATRWVEGRGQVLRDASGAPIRVVGVCMDVTERKRAEEALQAAARAKDEFLAMLGHELRNPLAALTAASHVLSVVDPAREEFNLARAIVVRQTKHMARLIADLVDISRVAFGKLALQRESFNLADAASNVIATWRASGRLDAHHVTLSVEPAWVDGDRARIEQITSNLLDNALKFTAPGAAVNLSVRRAGAEAVLQVADQGIGLTAEECGRVFDLFVQAERSERSERAGAGLGIGLALVKRLTELHAGSVSVSSTGRGNGAVFTVRLPAIPQPVTPAEAPATQAANGRSILIVDDNDDARHMLQTLLALGGHNVRTARDGTTGLALADVSLPDVALIDVALPDMDGYEVARRLRAAPNARRIGLVAVTGFGQAEDQQRAFEAGFDAHLVKPVSPERLEQVIAGLR